MHEALLDLRQIVAVLRRYLITLLCLPLILAGAGAYFASQEPPRYRAAALLQVNPRPTSAVREIQEPYNPGYGTDEYYNTQRLIIQSRTQIEKLVTELELDQVDEFIRIERPWYSEWLDWRKWLAYISGNPPPATRERSPEAKFATAVARARNATSAYRIPESNMFVVQFSSEDRSLAAQATNELAELYIESALEAKLEATRKAVSWINERLVDVSADLNESEQRLQAYRDRENLVNVGGARGLLEAELTDLTARLREAERRTSSLQSTYDQIEIARSNPETLSDVSALLLDPVVKSAADNFLEAQDELRRLERRYGERHPQMESAQARLNSARESYHEQMRIKAQGLRSELNIALENKQKLERDVARARQRIQELDRKEYQANLLERDVKTNQQVYDLFLSRVKETETQANYDEINARIVDPATVPGAPFEPDLKKQAMLYGLGGLVLSFFLIALRESLRSRIETPHDLEQITHLPTLGAIPNIKRSLRRKSTVKYFLDDPKSPFSDAIQSVKTAVVVSDVDRKWQCIAITSAVPQEGKTTTCAALAAAFAAGENVLVIDADLRRCSLGAEMGLKRSGPGLVDYLSGARPLEECIHLDEKSGIRILPVGSPPANPAQILTSEGFAKLLDLLRERYDRIFFDTPPTNATSDVLILLNKVDAVLMIARSELTKKSALQHSLKQLSTLKAPLIGVVLNDARARAFGAEHYGYYGYYGRY